MHDYTGGTTIAVVCIPIPPVSGDLTHRLDHADTMCRPLSEHGALRGGLGRMCLAADGGCSPSVDVAETPGVWILAKSSVRFATRMPRHPTSRLRFTAGGLILSNGLPVDWTFCSASILHKPAIATDRQPIRYFEACVAEHTWLV